MNVLETILSFLTTLARIIFPRRKRPVAGDDLCPYPLPEPPIPPLPVERGNGSNPRRSRSDSLPPLSPPPEADWLGDVYKRQLRLPPDAGRRDRESL